MMEQFQAFNQILYASGLRIEKLILSERGSWEIAVSGGLRLVAGRTAVRDKLKRFASIYDKWIGNDIADIEEIDLRYSNGFTVKKKQHDLSEVAVR
jgi:cell division protein FtsQ